MAVLDSPAKRAAVIEHLEGGGSADGAAAAAGIGRGSVNKYARRHPSFRDALDTAAIRGRQVLHNVGRPETRKVIDPDVMPRGPDVALDAVESFIGGDAADPPDHPNYATMPPEELRALYVQRMSEVVFTRGGEESRGFGVAARMLGAWVLEAPMVAARKRAEREESSGALEAARPDDADAKVRLLALVEARRKGADVVVG